MSRQGNLIDTKGKTLEELEALTAAQETERARLTEERRAVLQSIRQGSARVKELNKLVSQADRELTALREKIEEITRAQSTAQRQEELAQLARELSGRMPSRPDGEEKRTVPVRIKNTCSDQAPASVTSPGCGRNRFRS